MAKKKKVQPRVIKFTDHAFDRMNMRGIHHQEIYDALSYGKYVYARNFAFQVTYNDVVVILATRHTVTHPIWGTTQKKGLHILTVRHTNQFVKQVEKYANANQLTYAKAANILRKTRRAQDLATRANISYRTALESITADYTASGREIPFAKFNETILPDLR